MDSTWLDWPFLDDEHRRLAAEIRVARRGEEARSIHVPGLQLEPPVRNTTSMADAGSAARVRVVSRASSTLSSSRTTNARRTVFSATESSGRPESTRTSR